MAEATDAEASNTNDHTYEIRTIARHVVTKQTVVKKTETFKLTERYTVTNTEALGLTGTVCEAIDRTTGGKVAIKRCPDVTHCSYRSNTLRELKLLRLLEHENVAKLLDFLPIPASDEHTFSEVYMVFDYKETDLKAVLRSGQELNEEHFGFWGYQMLKGLKYLHSGGVIHGDLDPECILLTADSQLCISNLGRCHNVGVSSEHRSMIEADEYMVTRYYHAPEVICGGNSYSYTPAADVWSFACILAEMLSRRVFILGRDQVQQLTMITTITGSPSPEVVATLQNTNARRYMEHMPHHDRANFAEHFPDASDDARDLLEKLFVWDPAERITVDAALEHPFFEEWREPETETTCTVDPAELVCEDDGYGDMRPLIYEENTLWKERSGDVEFVV